MVNSQGAATIVNCLFTGNAASQAGAGFYGRNGDTAITNCTFVSNTALRGGGVGLYSSGVGVDTITNCMIVNNMAEGFERNSDADSVRLPDMSKASCAEVRPVPAMPLTRPTPAW